MSNYIELPETARRINGTMCWVTPDGSLYGIETRICRGGTKHAHYGQYFKYHTTINKHNGYVYAPIKYIIDEDKQKYQVRQRRLHIIIAEAFIENPNHYPVVGHRNNIKNDNRIENLYWTTIQENTQKAYDDGLAKNDKGYMDSQSMPVIMFDTCTNKELGRYGSIIEASKATGYNKSMIARQAKYKHPVRKPVYFRYEDDPSVVPPRIIVQYDM